MKVAKKILSVLLTLTLILGLGMYAAAPITAHAATTRSVSTSAELVTALSNSVSGDTIRLTAPITHTSQIDIGSNKTIIFDLNGYILNVTDPTFPALLVGTGSDVRLADPANGELNVTGGNGGVHVTRGRAEVTSAKVTGTTGYAVYAYGSEVTVYGNVTAEGCGSKQNSLRGVLADNGGKVMVNGEILRPMVDNGGSWQPTYVQVGTLYKSVFEYTSPTSKANYITYTDSGVNIVWVRDVVCQNVGTGAKYLKLQAAIDAVASGGTATIKMLDSVLNIGMIDVFDKNITLDLNGKKVDVSNMSGRALMSDNNGQLKLLNPANGELNVIGGSFGVAANTGAMLEVTNATTTGVGYAAAYAYNRYSGVPGEVIVYGNVTATKSGAVKTSGARADVGGKITVNGVITVPSNATYIMVGGVNKAQGEYEATTTKTGYLTYTGGTSTICTVWVKDTTAPVSWSGLTANGTSGSVTTTALTLTFSANPTTLAASDITVTGATKGTLTGTGTTRTLNISNITVANGQNVTVAITHPAGFTITPASRSVAVYVAPATVSWSNLTANGTSGSVTTTALTLTFSADPTTLAASNITVTGATKGTLTGTGTTRTLNISGITVANGQNVTVAITNPSGYTLSPSSRSVAVNVATYVCSIGTTNYTSLTDALNSVSTSGTATIKLLADISYNGIITIGNSKIITFDLNGKKLNINNTSGVGLQVNGATIKLLDPYNGEFNVSGSLYGVAAQYSSKVEVTNATGTGAANSVGVYSAGAGTEITAYGNASVSVGASSNSGVTAINGNAIINGKITVPAGATYIAVGTTNKTQSQYEASTSKTGYLTYTDSPSTSIVWVKDPAAAVPVTWSGLTANGTSGSVTTTALTLTFSVNPASLSASNITVTGATKGTLTGTGTTRTLNISNITVANGQNVTVAIENPSGYTLSPSSRSVAVYVAATYTITVNNGAANKADAAAGETVSITANAAPAGQVFNTWAATGVTLPSPNSASTSFTMPANAVTVTATYKPDGVSAAAQAVIDQINALPNPVATAADADKVAAATAAYNALSAADKAQIPQAVKDKLAAAQAQAAALGKTGPHPPPVTAIRSAQTTFYVVKGKSLTIPYAYDLAAGPTAQPVFTWTSDNNSSVSVTPAGQVKGLVAGKSAKVTVTSDNGQSRTFTVKVVKAALKATGVSVSKPPKTMAVGAEKILKVKISPAKATGAVVKFSLDKASKKVVTVDKAGKVTAIAKGTAKITVKVGGQKTVVTIKVK